MTKIACSNPTRVPGRGRERLAGSRSLAVAGGVLFTLAMTPGLPQLSFMAIGSLLGLAAYADRRAVCTATEAAEITAQPEHAVPPQLSIPHASSRIS
jgi:flagellar biosynthesis component FlhA